MNKQGQILLEGLLVLPFVCSLSFAAIYFAEIFFARTCLQFEAANAASRALHASQSLVDSPSICARGAWITLNKEDSVIKASIQAGSNHVQTKLRE